MSAVSESRFVATVVFALGATTGHQDKTPCAVLEELPGQQTLSLFNNSGQSPTPQPRRATKYSRACMALYIALHE
ncbi:hypothetical protein NDU88_007123 [Pleurodeles waltl]|uniref:Secreted protein n=1 Tax=Pleurodeles waltl TaxID=8319 RepID=A0AAV7PQH3_PLEWA|nr:hypothetical protein NDU88_007123 [Pleurodeles waltl]